MERAVFDNQQGFVGSFIITLALIIRIPVCRQACISCCAGKFDVRYGKTTLLNKCFFISASNTCGNAHSSADFGIICSCEFHIADAESLLVSPK
ncbi:hypothetical protein [uncultured Oscillibacter sp.]|uniref:hypothetical protein n=1 Tax=uncultured Oscillibacter sp. TaxID=876091 RepID=UPI002806148E|nr:hypothetical protein [uncultured Oscillibacter sp.]